jgi:hypothetical protein
MFTVYAEYMVYLQYTYRLKILIFTTIQLFGHRIELYSITDANAITKCSSISINIGRIHTVKLSYNELLFYEIFCL